MFFIFTIIASIQNPYYLIDILSQFKFQYFLFSTFVCIYFLAKHLHSPYKTIKTFIIILFLTSLINFTDIFVCKGSFVPDKRTAQSSIKISLVNVKTENTSYEKLNKLMENENPDIILLEEINTTWLENIGYIRKNYSYKIEHPRDDNFGIALYSKIPLNNNNC